MKNSRLLAIAFLTAMTALGAARASDADPARDARSDSRQAVQPFLVGGNDGMKIARSNFEGKPERLGVEGTLPPLTGATEWINSPPLTTESLRGKVVLISVWTYSCINSLRPLPYVRAWAEKYKNSGLVVVGVHSPEFAFEKISTNVKTAVEDHQITFPVAVDSNYGVWSALNNQYWPAFYFVDAQGRIRHHQFGESNYDVSERVIQQLLAESGHANVPSGLVSPHGEGVEAAPLSAPAQSEETYLGYGRSEGPASPGRVARDVVRTYADAPLRHVDRWALSGDWTVQSERVVSARSNGKISFRFHARDLHLVMGPSDAAKPVRFRVLLDGKAPLSDHGTDIDTQGVGTLDSHRLYQLIRQAKSDADHVFEIEFLDTGAEAYVFTFG